MFIKQLSHELVTEELQRKSSKCIGISYTLQQRLKRFKQNSEEEAKKGSSDTEKSPNKMPSLYCRGRTKTAFQICM